jgi:signal transduction histidine kinase
VKMDADQKDVVDTCIMSCNWTLTLINSLLDLARLESGQMPLQLCEVNIENLIESSLKQVTVWAEQKRVTLTSYLNRGVETVYTDPEVAMRILVNLLSNAIKFSQSESVVAVYVAPSNANMVAFSVTDQGPGILKEWVDKVFDKFVQVKARKAGSAVGSGLGLTFCRLAVEAQGGRIWLDSEIDKGTTVTFTLPMSAR